MTKTPLQPSNKAEIADDTIAIFTAYEPSENLKTSVLETLIQCTSVVIADNTPFGKRNARDVLGDLPRITIIGDGANIGLATVLNNAFSQAIKAKFVFLFDQNSCPTRSRREPALKTSENPRSRRHRAGHGLSLLIFEIVDNQFIQLALFYPLGWLPCCVLSG